MADLPPKFNELIQSSPLPVLVDFYADWCGPCKMVSPVIAQLATEYRARLVTIKINTEKKPAIAQTWQIQSIPTIMVFHKGKVLMRLSGAYPYGALKQELDKALAGL